MDGRFPNVGWWTQPARANPPDVRLGKNSGEFAQSPGGTGAVLRALVRAAKRVPRGDQNYH